MFEKTVRRRDAALEPTGTYLRRVLENIPTFLHYMVKV